MMDFDEEDIFDEQGGSHISFFDVDPRIGRFRDLVGSSIRSVALPDLESLPICCIIVITRRDSLPL